MAEFEDRENFIPITKNELIDLLIEKSSMSEADQKNFREFSTILAALFHFEYHDNAEKLKSLYAVFNPDADTVSQKVVSEEEKKGMMTELIKEFGEACESANYEKMSAEELNEAFEGYSPESGLELKLELGDYEAYELYYRGCFDQTKPYKNLKTLYKTKTFTEKVYKRLAFLCRVKDEKRLKKYKPDFVFMKLFKNVPALDLEMLFPTTKPGIKPLDRLMIFLPVIMGIAMLLFKFFMSFSGGAEVNQTRYIKKYKDAIKQEKLDVESKIAKNIESGNLIITYEAAPVIDEDKEIEADTIKGTLAKTCTEEWFSKRLTERPFIFDELWRAEIQKDKAEIYNQNVTYEMHYKVKLKGDVGIAIMKGVFAGAIMGLLVLFGSWAFKSVMKFLKIKQKYTGSLAETLFYLNLDNNAGVFTHLIDSAEEEEWKEAAFAYFFLETEDREFTEEELDDHIENWIEKNCTMKAIDKEGNEVVKPVLVDFEVDDAIGKLIRLELLKKEEKDGKEILVVPSWDKAKERLDYIWDNYYDFNG